MSIPHVPDEAPPIVPTLLTRQANASNEVIEDIYLRTRQTLDITKSSPQAVVVVETAKIVNWIMPSRAPAMPSAVTPAVVLRAADSDLEPIFLCLLRSASEGPPTSAAELIIELIPTRDLSLPGTA